MKHLRILFASSFFFAAHLAILAYINSSSLSRFIGSQTIGLVYAGSSVLSFLWLIQAPRLLRRFGNQKVTLGTLGISIISLVLLSYAKSSISIPILFAFYFSLNIFITYLLDIFIEHYSIDGITGRIRGLYLVSMNIAWVGAPFITGLLVSRIGFNKIYLIGAAFLLPTVFFIATKEQKFRDPTYKPLHIFRSLKALLKNKKVRLITFLNFLLHLFYAWMVIYIPLYLSQVQEFSWETIGIIFTFMLLPFIIFQYPAGRIADAILGEKELLVTGFLIMSLATFFLAFLNGASPLLFGIALFTTRIGASIVEVMSETYFFKQVTDKDTVFISFYRDIIPLAYIVAPLLGILIMTVGSYSALFITLAALMVVGAGFGMTLKDTK